MKPKTFSETLRSPKNGNDKEQLMATAPNPGMIETLPGQSYMGTETDTETEVEQVEGFKMSKPGEADKELYNRLSTENETESSFISSSLEEAGTEVTEDEGEGAFMRDAFFASYPRIV
jgi:glutamyl endopeptidase